MAAAGPPAGQQQQQFTLPLLAFQHHVGQLYVDPTQIQFVRELRQSDLAIVEQGRWRRPDGKVVNIVCKVWRPFVVATPQDFRELLLEASKLHRLQHSHVTRFLGLGCFAHGSLAEVRESMFMVEEYVGERTLRKLISEQMRCRHKNLYDARAAVRWASQVASALVALHEQQPPYVHNDVKADNVFLTDIGRVGAAEARLGDLKPHRHVYDREPCTLSRHQQQQRLQSPKPPPHPASLQQPKYTLERNSANSACSSGDDQQLMWSSSAASSTAGAAQQQLLLHGLAAASGSARSSLESPQQQQQQQQPQPILASSCFAAVGDSSSWSPAAFGTGAAASSDPVVAAPLAAAAAAADTAPATDNGSARVRSLPVPIAARSSSGSRSFSSKAGSCPADWNICAAGAASGSSRRAVSSSAAPAAAAAAVGSPATFVSAGSSQCSYSNFGGGLQAADVSSCPSSSAPANLHHSLLAEIAAADAAAAAAEEEAAAAGGAGGSGGEASEGSGRSWRSVRRQRSGASLFLSDSASSAAGAAPSSGKVAGTSLAADVAAEDAAAGVPLDGSAPLALAAKQGKQSRGSRKGGLATALASAKLDLQQQSAGGEVLQPQPPDAQQQQQAAMHLAHSAPDVMDRQDTAATTLDDAVHRGSLLMPLQLSEPSGLCSLAGTVTAVPADQAAAAAAALHAQQQKDAAATAAEQASKQRAAKQLQQQQKAAAEAQQQQQHHLLRSQSQPADAGSFAYYGWELLPSGAASPCGAVHSSLLDLFADVSADDVVTSRRYRDSCQYTLVPGSFVQHKAPLSISAAGPPPARSKSLGAGGWDPAATAATAAVAATNSSCSSMQVAASPDSKWTAAALLQLQQQNQAAEQQQQQPQMERGLNVGKGYAPSAIESKQHGGNSAFAALTAIDCIAEEGSSIATDSCAPSRESSAHCGTHFYSGSEGGEGSSGGGSVSQDGMQQQQQQPAGLPSLLSTESLTKALSLTSLLRHRSSGISLAGRSSSGDALLSVEDDRQDSTTHTRSSSSQPGSPGIVGLHGSSSLGDDPPGSKRHLLQLLVTASGGSDPSLRGGCADGSAVPADPTATADGPAAAADADAPTAAAATPPTKKVRFSLARPQGTTASRDFSLLYAAPELVRGERPTEKVDVFAFGVVLYELLSRSLIASSVAEVCARNNASRRGGRKHHQLQQHGSKEHLTPSAAGDSYGSCWDDERLGELPEHQVLLTYAQLVAGGYRPPMLPHFPEPVASLISSCWAAEPHERPRMAEVLQELQAWQKNRPLLQGLNSFNLALADMGYTGAQAKQPSCGCVIS